MPELVYFCFYNPPPQYSVLFWIHLQLGMQITNFSFIFVLSKPKEQKLSQQSQSCDLKTFLSLTYLIQLNLICPDQTLPGNLSTPDLTWRNQANLPKPNLA